MSDQQKTGQVNQNTGTMIGSSIGPGSRAVGNTITVGVPERARDLRAQLDVLLAALEEESGLDGDTVRTARYEITKIGEAAERTPPDAPAVRTRWTDLATLLAGAAPVSEHIGTIVRSVGEAVGALVGG